MEGGMKEECRSLTPKLQEGIELSHIFCLLRLGSSLSWVMVCPLRCLLISAEARNLNAVLGGTSASYSLGPRRQL